MPHILNALIWLPIIGGIFIFIIADDKRPEAAKFSGLLVSIFTLLMCIPLVRFFDINASGMQYIDRSEWLPQLGISYHLGIDGLSLLLIVLSVFTTLIVILVSWQSIDKKIGQYIASFLILQGLLVGVFSALDSIVFYVFWEASLVPMYLIIGIWGSVNRVYAAIKFFLYTFLGSILLLVAFLYMGYQAHTFEIATFYTLPLSLGAQTLIFVAFFFGFAIKIPMWPVHTWLPDAHTEAPAGGSIVLAAVLLKLGAYGFLRFCLPIVPDASNQLSSFMIVLSLIAVVYIGLVAIVQTDMKKLIAYSSISHMGFVTLGCFGVYLITKYTHNVLDAALILEGAIIVMISHGFVSSALFGGVGFLYDRIHSREIKDFGGIVNTMPIFASFFMLFAMANAGLPGTSGFVGEFMIILGALKANFWVGFWAATTLILGAAYTLWMYKRVIFGEITNPKINTVKDIHSFELLAFALLGVAVLAMGLYPEPVLNIMHQSVSHLLALSQMSKI